MPVMFRLFLIIAGLVFTLPVFGQTLHLVTSLDPLEAKEYIQAFEQETKIKVVMIRLSAGEVLARLKAEKNNPTQSVWFGGPSLDYVSAKKERLIESWKEIYFGSIAFVSYKPFLERKKLAPPASWEDLLKPEYEGEIAVALPYTSGTGVTVWMGLVQLMGEKKALAYWQRLDKNLRHYTKSGSGPVLETAMGEVGTGIAFSQDIWRKASRRGFPVVISYPKEGTPYEMGGVALVTGAKEQKEGEKFIDWIASEKGQNKMHVWGRYPVLSGSPTPKGLGGPKDVKLITMPASLGLKREELLSRWREIIKR